MGTSHYEEKADKYQMLTHQDLGQSESSSVTSYDLSNIPFEQYTLENTLWKNTLEKYNLENTHYQK